MSETKPAPCMETTCKVGNTTYIVNGFYASEGATATEKSSVYLTKKQKSDRAKI